MKSSRSEYAAGHPVPTGPGHRPRDENHRPPQLAVGRRRIRTATMMGDDLLRHGLVHLLSRIERFDLVGNVRRDHPVVDQLRALRPELLLMSADDAPPLADLLGRLDLRPKVLIVTDGAHDGATTLDLIRAGADGLVDRRSSATELLNSVQRVASGRTALDSHSVDTLIVELRSQRYAQHSDQLAGLTRREREVLALLTDGLDNRSIARDLFISEATVKFHLHNIMTKFGVRKRSALVSEVLRGHLPGGSS